METKKQAERTRARGERKASATRFRARRIIIMEKQLEDVWEVIHEWNHHLIDMFGAEHKIPMEDQDKLDDAKTAMAHIREELGLPSEVEKENDRGN